MEQSVSLETLLEKEGKIIYTNVGYSMYPLILENHDVLTLEKKTERLKRKDIGLFKGKNGHYILHRVIRVKKDGYDFAGDHNYWAEKNIKEEDVIGVLRKITRDGEEIPLSGKKYERYVCFCVDFYFLKCLFRRFASYWNRLLAKLKKLKKEKGEE